MNALSLRPLQLKAVEAVRQAFRDGHRCVVLYAPTGFGKSECAISMMSATADKGNRAAMILDRIVLCNQTSARLDKYGIAHGVLQSGHWRFRPYERIQVCSAQTLEKRGDLPDMKVLFVDECHSQRQQTSEFIKASKINVVGLTATPFAKGMGEVYSHVVCVTTTDELVREKFLVPLKVFVAKEIDMTGAKKVAGEWSEGEVAKRGIQITGDIVSEWSKKTHEIFGGPRKTIVFCAGVAHGDDLAKKFAEAGYDFRAISYKTDEDLKKAIIDDFSRPDTTINGLIATDILTKGFDVPDVMIGVSARPFSKSLSSHIQQMGRVMRSNPGKEFGLWIDHSGNYLGFQEDWEDVYYNGVHDLDDGKEKPRKEKTPKEREEMKCPQCRAVGTLAGGMCSFCGHQMPTRSQVEVVPGELTELEAKRAKKEDKQDFYSQLLGWADYKSFQNKEGWAAHKFQAKFGVWPRGLTKDRRSTSLEVQRWIKSQDIRFYKARPQA